MGKSDVEMEDAEKLTKDSGQNVKESENKMLDAKVENKGEKLSPAAAVGEDACNCEKGDEDPNNFSHEAADKSTIMSVMEEQINPKSEVIESINAEGSVGAQINTKSENEELSNTKTKAGEQSAAGNVVEEWTDAKYEVVEQPCSAYGGVEEVKSTENGINCVNPNEITMQEKHSEGVTEIKPVEIGWDDTDPVEHVAEEEKTMQNAVTENNSSENRQFPTELCGKGAPQRESAALDEVLQGDHEEKEIEAYVNEDEVVKDEPKEQGNEAVLASSIIDGNAKTVETAVKHKGDDVSLPNQQEAATPNSLVRYSPAKAGSHSGETVKTFFTQATLPLMAEGDDGTPEDQAAFMKELESFYRERSMEFKPPKFYGQPLNCLKLWRAVNRLGGYERVTGSKLWRQVGESFHPPKTCTTVSWTFRIFYEKSLLEYERHKKQSGEFDLQVAMLSEASGVDGEGNGCQGSGSGRAKRDTASRAVQGWHVQRLFDNSEVGEPIIKDKNVNNMAKWETNLKSIGSLKQKRPNEEEHSIKAARTETSKQLVTSVVDVGPPADWVKINVCQTKDCYEVYALVPGLLREEVRVQSDPAGRLVITGQPEQVDNPWGITAFKKVVSLPARIDPLQTSAVVSLHGRLFVRVPFEQSNS